MQSTTPQATYNYAMPILFLRADENYSETNTILMLKMLRVLILYGIVLFWHIGARGSHIAGGGIELMHIAGEKYRINLIIYFDLIRGDIRAKDPFTRVSFFSKSTNKLIFNKLLTLSTKNQTDSLSPVCSKGIIAIETIIYSAEVILKASTFNDPEGYYISSQRCCRNYNISNLYSDNPDITGGTAAGNTFYLEFPAVVQNGIPFINSSPHMKHNVKNYGCPGKRYTIDISARDEDGDSLTYSLVTPYSTYEITPLPQIAPRPYPTMNWRPGYSLKNIFGASSPVSLNARGILAVVPEFQGLYTVAIKIDQFRKGKLIGSNIQDFQILVVDRCDNSVPPTITGPTSVNLPYKSRGTDRCITVTVSDADGKRGLEQIKLRAIGLNFQHDNLIDILVKNKTATLENNSTKTFMVCFPQCPPAGITPYRIALIAEDDACSIHLSDTLAITVNAEVPPNNNPYFSEPPDSLRPIRVNVREGTRFTTSFTAKDSDGDSLKLRIDPTNAWLNYIGMQIAWESQPDNTIRGTLSWFPSCRTYDFTQQKAFNIQLLVDDVDECNMLNPARLSYDLRTILPFNNKPVIDTDLTPSPNERIVSGIQTQVFKSVSFTVTGEDRIDNDSLRLYFLGSKKLAAQNIEKLGIRFTEKKGKGLVQSTLNMDVQCAHITPKQQSDTIDLQFVVLDKKGKCSTQHSDTVQVNLIVLPPDNMPPKIKINNLNTNTVLNKNNEMTIYIDDTVALRIEASDLEIRDSLYLSMSTDDTADIIAPFATIRGKYNVSKTFTWHPTCNIFQNNVYEKTHALRFKATDNCCFNTQSDSTTITLHIKDRDNKGNEFKPINFFSPNGDGKNDYYAMLRINPLTKEYENTFPEDNCASQFENIQIYNRWGKQIFRSTNRDFKWFGANEPAGVYYYLIKYSNRTYKGSLSIAY